VLGKSVLEVSNLTKSFSGRAVLQGVSLALSTGEVLGYLGSNGAGKTTTILCILGLLEPNAGDIAISTDRLGFVMDRASLYDELTVIENLRFFNDLIGCGGTDMIEECYHRVSLQRELHTKIKTLSLGMRKRTEIARALLNRPSLIILDEPTSGLDPRGQADIKNLVKELAQQRGASLLITSHNLHEMEEMCTKVSILSRGKIRFSSTTEQIKSGGRSLESIYLELVEGEG
jgi:ABC-2 type transport system ATP-binding protein